MMQKTQGQAGPRQRPAKRILNLRVNGAAYQIAAYPSAVLLDVLRDELDLVGTTRGCDMGTCGCCHVLIDGRVEMSCLKLAFECEGHEIETIEGITEQAGNELHPIQRSWIEKGASQCGFCTPGFVMTSYELLNEDPDPSDAKIEEAISGNLCRCTGYTKIVEAIKDAGAQMRGGSSTGEASEGKASEGKAKEGGA